MDATYRWCLKCRRAYPAAQARRVQGRKRCAYVGCSGLYYASLAWGDLRQVAPKGELLPEVPVWNQVYPFRVRDGEIKRAARAGEEPALPPLSSLRLTPT